MPFCLVSTRRSEYFELAQQLQASYDENGEEEVFTYEDNPNHACSSKRNPVIALLLDRVDFCHKLGTRLCGNLQERRERLEFFREECTRSLNREGTILGRSFF
jgi:hypothetical protein